MNQDILFKTEDAVFSYRVSGILIHKNKILLQKPVNDNEYAYPGGHVNLFENREDALIREFQEEISADINVERLLWIGELFFPWGNKKCHQICFYYLVSLLDPTQIELEDSFIAQDDLEQTQIDLEFSWHCLSELNNLIVYPLNTIEKISNLSENIEQFTFIE